MERLFKDRICDCCGKAFRVPDSGMWRYRIAKPGGYWVFCSWKCIQEYRRKKKK